MPKWGLKRTLLILTLSFQCLVFHTSFAQENAGPRYGDPELTDSRLQFIRDEQGLIAPLENIKPFFQGWTEYTYNQCSQLMVDSYLQFGNSLDYPFAIMNEPYEVFYTIPFMARAMGALLNDFEKRKTILNMAYYLLEFSRHPDAYQKCRIQVGQKFVELTDYFVAKLVGRSCMAEMVAYQLNFWIIKERVPTDKKVELLETHMLNPYKNELRLGTTICRMSMPLDEYSRSVENITYDEAVKYYNKIKYQ